MVVSLNNNGETISLIDSAGQLVDSLNYSGSAIEGQAVTKLQELSVEVREKLFDDYANKVLPQNLSGLDVQFFIVMFFTAAVLAAISVFVYKEVVKDVYEPQYKDDKKSEPAF